MGREGKGWKGMGWDGKGWMILNRKGCNKKERDEKGINGEEF